MIHPIPVEEFALTESMVGPLLPIRWENQGVCTWAILLDGSNDPPVFVDVDSDGTEWRLQAPSFSTYVYTCVWDYRIVFKQPGLVQPKDGSISELSLNALAHSFDRCTHRSRSSTMYRLPVISVRHNISTFFLGLRTADISQVDLFTRLWG